MHLSVIIPTHCPNDGRLRRTLTGLREQTLEPRFWEVLLIDNASAPPVELAKLQEHGLSNLRVVPEPQLGLTHARKAGLREARADFIVFVDDDNVLSPGYLDEALKFMRGHPSVGLAGGRSIPEFECAPSPWHLEFLPMLALRDDGDEPTIITTLRPVGATKDSYPSKAPIGAGLVARRDAFRPWLTDGHHSITGRRGKSLASGEDNDIVLCAMKAGWSIAYVPQLSLTHLIPATRLSPSYLARLNRGIQESWMQVLTLHGINSWPSITPLGGLLRKLKSWFVHRPWMSPAAYVRWQGACGHFEGRVRR